MYEECDRVSLLVCAIEVFVTVKSLKVALEGHGCAHVELFPTHRENQEPG